MLQLPQGWVTRSDFTSDRNASKRHSHSSHIPYCWLSSKWRNKRPTSHRLLSNDTRQASHLDPDPFKGKWASITEGEKPTLLWQDLLSSAVHYQTHLLQDRITAPVSLIYNTCSKVEEKTLLPQNLLPSRAAHHSNQLLHDKITAPLFLF